MLNNIKSNYIVKKIFIHLYDRRQLKLIKYNKILQIKINISLYNYKIFSRRYIEYEKDGKGKEYNCDYTIIFEGDYFYDKKWNGKGYDKNNNIIYEKIMEKDILKNLIHIIDYYSKENI